FLATIRVRDAICVAKRVVESAGPVHIPDGMSSPNRVSEFVRSLRKRREDAFPFCVGRPLGYDKFQPTFARRTGFARVGSLEREALLHVTCLSDNCGQG